MLTVKQVADWLNLKPKTIYAMTARREIPCVRIGKRLRFSRHDLLRWLGQRKEE
ncbi:helix-turn-helix domain-containing protein [Candidatus Eisenbacteria bacterium]|uniref:Helix-turn-helix domain-containing protein n=1 Tax=Eiseniibacteriota bacterium TaxID=2212470 RepID=A0ABV6YMD7_UNCEI